MCLPSSESDIQTEEWAPVSFPKASGCVFSSVRGQRLASRRALGAGVGSGVAEESAQNGGRPWAESQGSF